VGTTATDHCHCKVCRRVCAADEETCSKACARTLAARVRSRQMYTYLMVGVAVFLLIVLAATFR
jgi:predicted nucleic acid-binding Zn ribbon protein